MTNPYGRRKLPYPYSYLTEDFQIAPELNTGRDFLNEYNTTNFNFYVIVLTNDEQLEFSSALQAGAEALERAGLSDAGAARLSGDGDLVAMTPSGGSLPLAGGDGPRYLTLEERGFYEVRPPGSDPDRPFILAVNPDLEESAVAALDAEQLAAAVTAPPGSSGSTGTSFEGAELRREDQERRQSLWRWLLLGAFGLLVAETVASNWLSRRRSGTPGLARG